MEIKENKSSPLKIEVNSSDKAGLITRHLHYGTSSISDCLYQLSRNSFQAGCKNIYIDVKKGDTPHSTMLSFKDDGHSMSEDFVLNEYTKIVCDSESCKGLSSKSPFMVADYYNLICVHEGIKSEYIVSSETGTVQLITSSDTRAANSTTVLFDAYILFELNTFISGLYETIINFSYFLEKGDEEYQRDEVNFHIKLELNLNLSSIQEGKTYTYTTHKKDLSFDMSEKFVVEKGLYEIYVYRYTYDDASILGSIRSLENQSLYYHLNEGKELAGTHRQGCVRFISQDLECLYHTYYKRPLLEPNEQVTFLYVPTKKAIYLGLGGKKDKHSNMFEIPEFDIDKTSHIDFYNFDEITQEVAKGNIIIDDDAYIKRVFSYMSGFASITDFFHKYINVISVLDRDTKERLTPLIKDKLFSYQKAFGFSKIAESESSKIIFNITEKTEKINYYFIDVGSDYDLSEFDMPDSIVFSGIHCLIANTTRLLRNEGISQSDIATILCEKGIQYVIDLVGFIDQKEKLEHDGLLDGNSKIFTTRSYYLDCPNVGEFYSKITVIYDFIFNSRKDVEEFGSDLTTFMDKRGLIFTSHCRVEYYDNLDAAVVNTLNDIDADNKFPYTVMERAVDYIHMSKKKRREFIEDFVFKHVCVPKDIILLHFRDALNRTFGFEEANIILELIHDMFPTDESFLNLGLMERVYTFSENEKVKPNARLIFTHKSIRRYIEDLVYEIEQFVKLFIAVTELNNKLLGTDFCMMEIKDMFPIEFYNKHKASIEHELKADLLKKRNIFIFDLLQQVKYIFDTFFSGDWFDSIEQDGFKLNPLTKHDLEIFGGLKDGKVECL